AQGDGADRDRVAFAPAVDDLYVAAECVGGVVVVEDPVVEALDDFLAVGLRHLGVDDGDEVVAADVADERTGLADAAGGDLEAAPAAAARLVAAPEAVVVAERLEVAEVAVDQRDRLARRAPLLDLLGDAEVARQAGARPQVPGRLG